MSFRFGASAFKKRYGEKMDNVPLLGEGKYGQVFLVNDKLHSRKVAVKIVRKNKLKTLEDKTFMQTEMSIHKNLDHPHIVKLYEVFYDKKRFYLSLEIMSGGELFDRIFQKGKSFSEKKAALVTKRVAEALCYLHDMNIVHRDLKPENLLLPSDEDDTNVKLADFGIAARCDEPLHSGYGTLMYIAPEILCCQPYKSEVDLWSLGVIVFSMLAGKPPFYSPDESEMATKIVSRKLAFIPMDWDQISAPAKDLVRNLLERDQSKRFTAKDVLEHPWVANAEEMEEKELEGVSEKMREFKAKSLLMQAIRGVNAIEKMRNLIKHNNVHEEVESDLGNKAPADISSQES